MLQLTYVPHVPHHIKSVQNLQLTHNTAAMRSITMAFFIIMCLGLTWVYLQKVLVKNTRNTILPIKNTTTERPLSTPLISGIINSKFISFGLYFLSTKYSGVSNKRVHLFLSLFNWNLGVT